MKRRRRESTKLGKGKTEKWFEKRGEYILLALIFVIYFLLVYWYSSLIPLGKGVDEEAHFLYVEDIRDLKTLPILQVPHKGHYESHQPPLFYLLSLPIAFLGGENWRIWGRWFSSIVVAVGGFICYLAGKRLFGDNKTLYLGAPAFLLFLPGNIAISAGFTNDTLAQALFALAIYFFIKNEKMNWLWAGIATAGAILSKLNCMVLVPSALLVLILSLKSEDRDTVLRKFIFFLAPILLLSGWWFVRNKLLYGDFLGWRIFQKAFDSSPHPSYFLEKGFSWVDYWRLVLITCYASFWTPLIKLRFLPWGYYFLPGIFSCLAFIGFLKWLKEDENNRLILILIALSFFFLFLSFLRFNLYFFEAQGRYLYPALSAFALLYCGGLGRLNKFLLLIFIFYLLILALASSSILY